MEDKKWQRKTYKDRDLNLKHYSYTLDRKVQIL